MNGLVVGNNVAQTPYPVTYEKINQLMAPLRTQETKGARIWQRGARTGRDDMNEPRGNKEERREERRNDDGGGRRTNRYSSSSS
eukprot:4302594-Pyramimonas_sp.AAC.1